MPKKKQKKNEQKRHWMGTIQVGHLEHTTDTFADWWLCLQGAPGLVYAVGQIEEADTGSLHIQVYTEWKTSLRRSEVIKRAGSGHWTPRRESRTQCRDYCRKKESRVEKLGEIGTWRADVASEPMESPKVVALRMLIEEGKNPAQIVAERPDVFFTHHRAILETWKMMQGLDLSNLLSSEEE